jgi:hypothetical protein
MYKIYKKNKCMKKLSESPDNAVSLNDVEQLNDLVMSSLLNAANLSIPKTRKNTKYHKSLPNK